MLVILINLPLGFSPLVYIPFFFFLLKLVVPKDKSIYVTTLIKNLPGCPCISAYIRFYFQIWHTHLLSLLFYFNLALQLIFHYFLLVSFVGAYQTASSSRLFSASSGLLFAFTHVLSSVQCLLSYLLPYLAPPDRTSF